MYIWKQLLNSKKNILGCTHVNILKFKKFLKLGGLAQSPKSPLISTSAIVDILLH
jgi:hypothetical protein